ncbi:MAG TPA: SpoIIE family protein phosphatase [Haliangiales bacterium]|nr:SpoIIE family protein phosphatase [Haliangiales bacterium]
MERLAGTPRWLEWGAASAAHAGEGESGDRYVVRFRPDGALLAVVDGLGHGPEAARAATAAAALIEEHAADDLVALLHRCHAALRDTRGVVMCVAAFKPAAGEMEWLSVGDVEGVLARRDGEGAPKLTWLAQRSGVVGAGLPMVVSPSRLRLRLGDTLALASDGVRTDFSQLTTGANPQDAAERILAECRRADDDALVLVARYRGRTP